MIRKIAIYFRRRRFLKFSLQPNKAKPPCPLTAIVLLTINHNGMKESDRRSSKEHLYTIIPNPSPGGHIFQLINIVSSGCNRLYNKETLLEGVDKLDKMATSDLLPRFQPHVSQVSPACLIIWLPLILLIPFFTTTNLQQMHLIAWKC